MEHYFDNFIGVFDNFFPENYIDAVVDHFKDCKKKKRQEYQSVLPIEKTDYSVEPDPKLLTPEQIQYHKDLQFHFYKVMEEQILPLYYDKYSSLAEYRTLNEIRCFKIQGTSPGEGYHTWHYEYGPSTELFDRWGVYTLYLNDIEEGGETEFLYVHKRVKPKKGRLCIFPSGYTHTHRGNPPLKETKYIATGWLHYTPPE